MVSPCPARNNRVRLHNFAGLEFRLVAYSLVHGGKVDVGKLQQLAQIVEDEIRFLKVIDPIAGPHDAFEREPNAIG